MIHLEVLSSFESPNKRQGNLSPVPRRRFELLDWHACSNREAEARAQYIYIGTFFAKELDVDVGGRLVVLRLGFRPG